MCFLRISQMKMTQFMRDLGLVIRWQLMLGHLTTLFLEINFRISWKEFYLNQKVQIVNNYNSAPIACCSTHIIRPEFFFISWFTNPSTVIFRKGISKIIFSPPEPKAHGWANSIPVTPASVRRSSVRQHFQTYSPLKPLGQLNSNFIWRLLGTRNRKFVQMVLVTWPRWPPRPYMVKTL